MPAEVEHQVAAERVANRGVQRGQLEPEGEVRAARRAVEVQGVELVDLDVVDVLEPSAGHVVRGVVPFLEPVADGGVAGTNVAFGYTPDRHFDSHIFAKRSEGLALRAPMNRSDFRFVLQVRMELDEQEVVAGDA